MVALANALELTAQPLRLSDVTVSGIEHVTKDNVVAMLAKGMKLRLVGAAQAGTEGGAPSAFVRLEELDPSDPFYWLNGADAAVTFYTDRMAPITVTQHVSDVNSSRWVDDTAFGEFADMMRACRPAAP